MENEQRAEKYLELFLDAKRRKEKALKELKYYRNMKNYFWGKKALIEMQQSQLRKAKAAKAAQKKCYKTLTSILGVLNSK